MKRRDTPSYRRHREMLWQQQDMRFLGKPMTFDVYVMLRGIQRDSCALCGADLDMSFRNAEAVDHDHESHEVRGILCGSRDRCNTSLVKRFEAGKLDRLDDYTQRRIMHYLAHPPAEKLRALFIKDGMSIPRPA